MKMATFIKKYNCIFMFLTVIIFVFTNTSVSQLKNFDQDIYTNNVKNCEIYKALYKSGEADLKNKELIKKTIYLSGYIYAEIIYTSGKIRKYEYNDNFILEDIVVEYKDEWNYSHKETHKIEYDDRRNPIKESVFSKKGKLEYRVEYLYDDKNNIIDSKTIESDESISAQQKYKYQYDSLGKITLKEEYKKDYSNNWELSNYVVYSYTPSGKIDVTKSYTAGNLQYNKVKYFYGDNGLLEIKGFYDLEGKPEHDEYYIYEYK